jgi:hypothetical protein
VKRLISTTIILLLTLTATFSQELRLTVTDKLLNTVLNSLNVEISFDDKALSGYSISVAKTFRSPEEAINFLLKDKPFKMGKIAGVYVISPVVKETEKSRPTVAAGKTYTISGELFDPFTGEPLPYAYIQTVKGVTVANGAGFFSLVSNTDAPLRIQVQYIGYEMLDTLLSAGNHRLPMITNAITLDEVVVNLPSPVMLMQSGRTSGEVRINPQTARYLPGSADNSVFNLMRMIPGVRASGEPSEDLIVWGSNTGESQLIYDGFTIYGMKAFNDQISAVNPYMTKDMRLLKGGFDASTGNRIGAVAEITGVEGDFNKPTVKVIVSNYTANVFASVPLTNRAAVSAACRQTFYNLYDKTRRDAQTEEHDRQGNLSGVYINPKYDFRDLNLKLAGNASDNDYYYISLYGADDRFNFSVTRQNYEVDATEKNRQYGVAGAYNRVWNSGNDTKLLLSFSRFSASIDNISGITSNQSAPLQKNHIDNSIRDISLSLEHRFNIGERQQLQIGGKWQQYASRLNGGNDKIDNPALYITDNVLLGKLSVLAGLRADRIISKKIYIQPRLSARYAISDEWTVTASFGIYNQFLTRIPYRYGTGSYQLVWNLSDTDFLSSSQFLAGTAYSKNGWLLSVEGYLKKNRNGLYFLNNTVCRTNSAIPGVDVYVKKQWKQNTVFGSYSLVNTSQPQNATGQEIKLGGVYTLRTFHFSATYVYGTGFPHLATGGHGHNQGEQDTEHGQNHGQGHQNSGDDSGNNSSKPYSRFDLSFTCRFQLKKIRLQAGASALNVFNTNNVKYNYRLANQNNVINVYTKATPFTPTVFLEIIF